MKDELGHPDKISAIPRSGTMAWLALLLAVAVFILDLLTLHGQGEAVLYVVVVLVFLWSIHWRYVLAVAAACSLLTMVGSFYSANWYGGPPIRADITNYIFSLVAIWLSAILGLRMNRLSEKLVASELRMRTIVEMAAEGIIAMNERGTIESCNAAAAKMFGYEIHEVVGKNIKMLLPASQHAAHALGQARQGDIDPNQFVGTTAHSQGRRSDGTTISLLIAVSAIGFGSRRLFTWIITDMTQLNIAQDRAIQAERLAAIGEAMTGLAHESRNALQRSQAALELLLRLCVNQTEAVELIGRAQGAQDDLHRLYEEVREYAAPMKLKRQNCRLDSIVQQAWEVLTSTRTDRDAQLDQQGTQLDLRCAVDNFVLRRVFRNMLDNSFDAGEGPLRITINYAEASLNGHPAITLSLRDNGPGMDEQARQKLFEPFFTTKTSGTGLGMAIAKRCVEAHGGIIDVAANSGDGVEFRITLPKTEP